MLTSYFCRMTNYFVCWFYSIHKSPYIHVHIDPYCYYYCYYCLKLPFHRDTDEKSNDKVELYIWKKNYHNYVLCCCWCWFFHCVNNFFPIHPKLIPHFRDILHFLLFQLTTLIYTPELRGLRPSISFPLVVFKLSPSDSIFRLLQEI